MGRISSSAPTPPQGRILGLLLGRELAGVLPPTLREIAGELGWRAPGTVRDHIRALVRKGYLSRSRLARDLRLTDSGREAARRPTEQSPPATPRSFSSETKEIFTLLACDPAGQVPGIFESHAAHSLTSILGTEPE